MMKKTLKLLISILLLPIVSCSQNLNHSFSDFRTSIYDTCHLMGEFQVPNEFWFNTDKNGDLSKDVDSVLFAQIRGGIDDKRLEELDKCSYLGFYEFKSSSISNNLRDRVDFKNFPELRYVTSDYLLTENQFTDLLKTGKKLNGLNIRINFPVPDCLCELDQLRYLIITNNGGVTLPSCIQDMSNLKYLELNGEGIGNNNQLNDVIWNIPSLELLRIDGGSTVEIKPSVENMSQLKQLDITSVDSIIFPSTFDKLNRLEIVQISWVEGEIFFPTQWSKLKSIKAIDLAQVQLNQLPLTRDNQSIEFLRYSNIHDLNTKDIEFNRIDGLKHLWMSGRAFNEINEMPSGIESLSNLESIEMINFGFLLNNAFRKKINDYDHHIHFGGDFNLTFDHYKWLFIFGKPAKIHPKMY